jgi:DNA-binding transcriptional MerR regulator
VTSTYTIREAAERSGLSMHTLRWYERIGLLERVPRGVDGRRRFREDDLGWLELIGHLRSTGMPVAKMIEYAELVRAGGGNERERLGLLSEHREKVLDDLVRLNACLSVLDKKISGYSEAAGGC